MIHGIIIHIQNELPIVADIDELPAPGDRMIRCTNVRTVDGKRPSFVHERNSMFVFPLDVVRLIEVPQLSQSMSVATQDDLEYDAPPPPPPVLAEVDEEAEEDLLARIRQI